MSKSNVYMYSGNELVKSVPPSAPQGNFRNLFWNWIYEKFEIQVFSDLKKKKLFWHISLCNCQRYDHVQIQHKYHLGQREQKHKEVRLVLKQYRQWKPNLAPRDYKAKRVTYETQDQC